MRRPQCPATTAEEGVTYRCVKPRWHWGRVLRRAHDSGPGRVRIIWARTVLGPWTPGIPDLTGVDLLRRDQP